MKLTLRDADGTEHWAESELLHQYMMTMMGPWCSAAALLYPNPCSLVPFQKLPSSFLCHNPAAALKTAQNQLTLR